MISQEIKKLLTKIPDCPGVYSFIGERADILYIGKATSLKNRVRSYFASNLVETRGPKVSQMLAKITDIKFIKTDSVLEALVLEAELIKKHQPKHNSADKDDKSFNYVVITKEEFPRVLLARGRDLEKKLVEKIKYKFGPFPEGGMLREAMKILRKIFPWRDRCVPAVELTKFQKASPCFNSQIGLCPGVCVGKISKEDYAKTISNLKLFFLGKKKFLIRKLEKEMNDYAREMKFEKAAETKNTIFSLKHIHDVSLMKREIGSDFGIKTGFRIEAYDISHTGGQEVVGSMSVIEDGVPVRSEYRKFKIKGGFGVNDTASLREVLERRVLHDDWRMPDMVVVDGSTPQKDIAEIIFKKINPKIVAVVKNDKHEPEKILGDENVVAKFKKDILLGNAEAHRFAISFHKKRRSGKFLPKKR